MTIISSDTATTINSSAVNETIIIVPDVTVDALVVTHAGVSAINYGRISFGVAFTGSGELINHEDGLILDGVALYTSVNVVNHGMIFNGFSQYGIQFLGANAGNVSNSGEIYGSNAGVLVNASTTVGASISNSGEIRADNHGIWLANSLGGAPAIVNSGTIIGRTNAIFATSGDRLNVINTGVLNGNVRGDSADQADSVTNNKTILGNVFLGSGNDSYKGIGTVSGTVFGEAGNDSLSGGNAIDRLDGGLGNDTLTGNAGKDLLTGGDGNDRLFGGIGNDNLTGGGNSDIFVFNTALNSSTNRDIVTDFNHVADTFWLENAIMTKLGVGVHALSPLFFRAGAAALDANDYIVYNRTTGLLVYDANGNAAGGAVAIATLSTRPALAANDFLVV